jgi:hypothetical protein
MEINLNVCNLLVSLFLDKNVLDLKQDEKIEDMINLLRIKMYIHNHQCNHEIYFIE